MSHKSYVILNGKSLGLGLSDDWVFKSDVRTKSIQSPLHYVSSFLHTSLNTNRLLLSPMNTPTIDIKSWLDNHNCLKRQFNHMKLL